MWTLFAVQLQCTTFCRLPPLFIVYSSRPRFPAFYEARRLFFRIFFYRGMSPA
jgi:(2Fe-2S) ferredoxin